MRRGTKSAILLPSSSTPIYPCDSTTVSLPPSSSTSNASSQQELDDKEVTQITQSQGPLRFPEMDTATKLPMIAFSNDKTHPPSSQQDDTSWHLPAIVERGKMSDMPGSKVKESETKHSLVQQRIETHRAKKRVVKHELWTL